MVALGIVNIVAGVVVEKLDIVDETAADMATLEEVVTEDEVLGEGALENLLENAEIVNTLSTEGAFVENVLIASRHVSRRG